MDQAPALPISFVRTEHAPALPPPMLVHGPVAWARANLFGGVWSSLATLVFIALLAWILPGLVRYLVIDAVWSAPDGEACRAPGAGACWAYVAQKFSYFMYASYPRESVWRVDLTLAAGAALVAWLLWRNAPRKALAGLLFFVAYPFFAFAFLRGWELVGLGDVPTDLWGGVFVSLLVATVGIVVSLPGGVLLALGRRSRLPIVRIVCVVFNECVRGVPLISVLFMANFMLPLFVPANWTPDRLMRPLIGISLFASAYMAEVIRGGLQAMPKGQFEGAMSVGLTYW